MHLSAIILAAGQGTRMKSNLPKVMHKIGGLPIIEHILELTKNLSSDRTLIVINPTQNDLRSYLTDKYPDLDFVTQLTPLGTGNAVDSARKALETYEGNLIILYGDVPLIQKSTISEMLTKIDKETDLVVLGFNTAKPKNYGRLIKNEDNYLKKIIEEKNATDAEKKIKLCNSGIICGNSKSIFSLVSLVNKNKESGEFYLTDIIELAGHKGLRSQVLECNPQECQGINSRADLAEAEYFFQCKMRQEAFDSGVTLEDPASVYFSHDTKIGRDSIIAPNVYFGPGVKIAENVKIFSFSHLEGCDIYSGARIGPFARIRPGSKIFENSKVGNFVEVKNAELQEGTKANHLAYIGDAKVGEKSNIGAGTIFCNFDGVSKNKIDVGKNAFVGSNTALIAPLSIGSDTIIGAGSVISEDVPDQALAVERGKQRTKVFLGKKIMEKLRKLKKIKKLVAKRKD